ncbi:D12 class N6 adenine-specific DNA methyltransferase [Dickeya parazeae Ech586]|uniref:site-specific DNA-methyltransferase (adenine-specific) n=1 Tax=Dickeya zeae (strain Ech586) TaxID=590409 RepID=D2BY15_DICZ5|nr:DNA adenine methylase [Dickeya parazeae]ACZ78607.1 D12 class N6 adenine-specific DNA methyltransferase [Dickeya parazeae Ech586]
MGKRILEHEAIKQLSKKSVRKLFGVHDIPRASSPFRYPGGKDKLTSFLAIFLTHNKLVGARFIEPFCGGAGASLSLLIGGYVKEIHLNDKNYALYCFWDQLINNTDKLLDLVYQTTPSIDGWHIQRDIYNLSISDRTKYSKLEYGFSAFYLNRANRSGVLGAGPIGGLEQTGNYKIDCRYTKNTLIKKLERIAEMRNSIFVYNEDCIDFLRRFDHKENYDLDFVYLDPPYVKEGKNIYSKDFCFDDFKHKELKDFIVSFSNRWLISYDDHPLVHELYSQHGTRAIEFSYVMNQAKVGKELMIADSRLRMPESLFTIEEAGENNLELGNKKKTA